MKLSVPQFFKGLWERSKTGENMYYINSSGEWAINTTNLSLAQNHPILTPAILFVSKLFSQAEFKIENSTTKKITKSHWLLELLESPNYFQTKTDFLESLMFMMIAQGKAVVYCKRTTGIQNVDSMYILDSDLIEYPDEFKTKMLSRGNIKKSLDNTEITYDNNGADLKIKIKDLLFFYDLPNALDSNLFSNRSRLDGLKQTLVNTKDSLLAKNIILKTNGKELITGEKDGFPLLPEEKLEAEMLFNNNYGLSGSRRRGLITKASLNWKSLHIALRDLGLDESVKVDGNLIYTALHIPKDILSLEAKKTTYNNYKESMVSYIQNEIQSSLNSFNEVLQKLIDDDNLKLVGSYEHLPVMQFIMLEKYGVVKLRAETLKALLDAGVPEEDALEQSGFNKKMKLKDLQNVLQQDTEASIQPSPKTTSKGS